MAFIDEIDRFDCDECQKYNLHKQRNCTGVIRGNADIQDRNSKKIVLANKKGDVAFFCPKIALFDGTIVEVLDDYILVNNVSDIKELNWTLKHVEIYKEVKRHEKQQLHNSGND